MSTTMTAATIGVVALTTCLIRGLPYILFQRRKIPMIILYLGAVLPASIMVILLCYCLRHINFIVYPFGIAETVSVLLVIVIQFWKKNTIISTVIGTACYMILIRIFF